MENAFWSMGAIKEMGMIVHTLKADLAFPMIATRDVAEVAKKFLLELKFSGKSTIDILGQRDLSMREVAKAIGGAIGKKELGYLQVPYEAAEKEMINSGLSPDAARLMNELMRGINEGVYQPTEARSPENTTATSIEQFSKDVFAPVYNSQVP